MGWTTAFLVVQMVLANVPGGELYSWGWLGLTVGVDLLSGFIIALSKQ